MNDKIYPSMVIRSQAEAIELLEKENQQLKKQKYDVVEYIKKHKHLNWYVESCYTDDLLRMLGEIDVED